MKKIVIFILLFLLFPAHGMDRSLTTQKWEDFIYPTTHNIIDTAKEEQLYQLLTIIEKCKAPKLYALLLERLLLTDVTKIIGHMISSLKHLTELVIKKTHTDHHIQLKSLGTDHAMIYHPNGNYCACLDTYGIGSLYDTETFTKIMPIDSSEIIFNPHYNQLLKKADNITLCNIDTKKTHILENSENIYDPCFSPNGKFIAGLLLHQPHIIRLWFIDDNESIQSQDLIGHSQAINTINFNPQSTRLISASPETTNCIIQWDLSDHPNIKQTTILTGQHRHYTHFIFNNNGSLALVKTNTNSILFTVDEIGNYHYNSASKLSDFSGKIIKFIPHENRLIYVDKQNNLVIFNPLTQTREYITEKIVDHVMHFVCSKNGKKIATCHEDGTVNIWKRIKNSPFKLMTTAATIGLNRSFVSQIHAFEFDDNDFLLVYGPKNITLWNKKGISIVNIQNIANTYVQTVQFNAGKNKILSTLQKAEDQTAIIIEHQLLSDENKKIIADIKQNISPSQALFLNKLSPENVQQQVFTHENGIDYAIYTSFKREHQELLKKITYNM